MIPPCLAFMLPWGWQYTVWGVKDDFLMPIFNVSSISVSNSSAFESSQKSFLHCNFTYSTADAFSFWVYFKCRYWHVARELINLPPPENISLFMTNLLQRNHWSAKKLLRAKPWIKTEEDSENDCDKQSRERKQPWSVSDTAGIWRGCLVSPLCPYLWNLSLFLSFKKKKSRSKKL